MLFRTAAILLALTSAFSVFAEGPEEGISRFSRYRDTHGQHGFEVTEYRFSHSRWEAQKTKFESFQIMAPRFATKMFVNSWCAELLRPFTANTLAYLQYGAIEAMVKEGYLRIEDAAQLAKMSMELHPLQYDFYGYRKSAESTRESSASMWVVNGQFVDESGNLKRGELPWMKDPNWTDFEDSDLASSEPPFIWEWGRVLSTDGPALNHLLSVAAMEMMAQVKSHGGSVDRAFVYFHALDEKRTRAFSIRHPGRILSSKSAGKDSVFKVPLREILEKYTRSH